MPNIWLLRTYFATNLTALRHFLFWLNGLLCPSVCTQICACINSYQKWLYDTKSIFSVIRRLDLARKNDKKNLSFWCFDQPLVVCQRLESLDGKDFFSSSGSSIYPGSKKKSKKIKKKIQVFACFCQPLGLSKIRSIRARTLNFSDSCFF